MKKKLLNQLKEIAIEFNLDLFVLFGSRAINQENINSDWDFAFYSHNKINFIKLYSRIQNIIKSNIDLVDLNSNLDPYFKYSIIKDSILIFESENGLYDEIFSNLTIEYIKFKPYLKLEEEIINEKFEI